MQSILYLMSYLSTGDTIHNPSDLTDMQMTHNSMFQCLPKVLHFQQFELRAGV